MTLKELCELVAAQGERLAALEQCVQDLTLRFDDVAPKLAAKNRSSPVKKEMTREDAMRVLTGDLKDVAHKEAGEASGLTYAQVYSCRYGYTFKYVHRDLEKDGWKNPWQRKG